MASIKLFLTKQNDLLKKIALGVIIILFIILGLSYVNYLKEARLIKIEQQGLVLNVDKQVLNLEIVATPDRQHLGLSKRPSLCSNCGMLFIFHNAQLRNFVMRDMEFPLDIIFISDDRIVKIYENLPPEGSSPANIYNLSLIHISEPTRRTPISYAVFC